MPTELKKYLPRILLYAGIALVFLLFVWLYVNAPYGPDCDFCNDETATTTLREEGLRVCASCLSDLYRCYGCNRPSIVYGDGDQLCAQCFAERNKLYPCEFCGKYSRLRVEEPFICSVCIDERAGLTFCERCGDATVSIEDPELDMMDPLCVNCFIDYFDLEFERAR